MISFKDRLKKAQEDPRSNNHNQKGWNGYAGLIGQLSQRSSNFEPGELRKVQSNSNFNTKRRTSTQILELDCEEQDHPSSNYYEKTSHIKSNHQGSLMGSKVNENYNPSLLQSKLHETKGQICEQMSDLERRIRKQIDEDRSFIEDYIKKQFTKLYNRIKTEEDDKFEQIVSQLNKTLNTLNKKQKILEGTVADEKETTDSLKKQFNQFIQETEEKLEKVMNSDPSSSTRKSFSRNMEANYMMQLKSSIKEIPLMPPQPGVEDIKADIYELQENIKGLCFDLDQVKKQFKSSNYCRNQPPKALTKNTELVQSSKMQQMVEDMKRLDRQLQDFCSSYNSQKNQVQRILGVQEQNLIGMNEMFGKVVNTQMIPRLKKVEEQVTGMNGNVQQKMQGLKKNIIRQLESMPIIRVNKMSEEDLAKMKKMKQMKGQREREVYLLDQENHILDCFGNYLLGESNQRLKIEEDQIYYLQQVEGIQFRPAPQVPVVS